MRKKVNEMAAIVGMTPYLTASPHDLSGGQKQRVTMAGVMTHDADIMLFDEPLASLDPHTGKSSIEFIEQISRDTNKTIIIIEHRLEEVLHGHIDRVIVMYDGRIVADLPPAELLQSKILRTYGIREPLYIAALRNAGVKISEIVHPENINSLDIIPIRSQLQAWMQSDPPHHNIATQQPILAFQSVTFGFIPDQPVLQNITLSIHRGEMVSVIGKNGAGKSTLSRLICGSLKPQSGEIKLDGQSLTNQTVKERASRIGYVMQNPNQMLFKSMIADEVGYGLTLRGLSAAEITERVMDCLHICGLYAYRNWPIAALSYGQKKRVTIAAVLALDPEILILDEPTAGQDLRHYTEILHFVEKLNHERGLTIMMITHDMHLMLEYSNRALVIADGQLIADQHPSAVLSDLIITERANLKMTSLYTLALRAGIPDPTAFIRQFILQDREERNQNDNLHAVLHSS
jgi:energy-coupling factor transport system ATP-binding protein